MINISFYQTFTDEVDKRTRVCTYRRCSRTQYTRMFCGILFSIIDGNADVCRRHLRYFISSRYAYILSVPNNCINRLYKSDWIGKIISWITTIISIAFWSITNCSVCILCTIIRYSVGNVGISQLSICKNVHNCCEICRWKCDVKVNQVICSKMMSIFSDYYYMWHFYFLYSV